MGWLSEALNTVHTFTKKYDPIGHYSVGNPLKTGDWLVQKGARGVMSLAKDLDPNDKLNAYKLNNRLERKAGENMGNFGLSAQRAGTVAALVYGGISAYGAATGGTASGGAGAGAAGGGSEVLGTAGGSGSGGIGASEALGSAGSAGGAGSAPSAIGYGAEGMSGYTMPASGGASAGASATAGAGGSSLLSQVASNKAAQGLAVQAAQAAAAKKPSEANQGTTRRPVEMPDPEAQAAARRRRLAEQINRRGRAASILTASE